MSAVRVLTGVLLPQTQSGSVVINFDTHDVPAGQDATGVELNESGAAGRFVRRPGKVVSLRQIRVSDKDTFLGGSQIDIFTLNDGVAQDNMTVSWSSSGGSTIQEISYLVVGEA